MQRGVGLGAVRTTQTAAAAAAVFLEWITETETNLEFVTAGGYLPVRREAFEALLNGAHGTLGRAGDRRLMDYLAAQDALAQKAEPEASGNEAEDDAAFAHFVENITTLSAAERAVFDLYLKGLTAREIAETLYLSINTIKTHNRRIYAKLNVSSRKELMAFIRRMQAEPK